ncbi:Protein of unknown function, DUF547 [Hoeflea sp. IMCC20628]|uniref:DUF547 domain-containing protein n=1 Tax=Hoeflea sp. IMCC20628 TaxID=1620421 RepID=UPI00063BD8C6|nr:DUF547 domain-containing protein [Hoeflea sp. IMCC20628]AKI02431.1 Protein of unknown function, DUF547 [Hoeflea sp. IMCC20628]
MHPDRRAVVAGLSALIASTALNPLPAMAALTGFRPKGQAKVDHSRYDTLLKSYVRSDANAYNRVDYGGVKANLPVLRDYIAALESVDPVSLSRNEAHAYWINLYNAKTLEVVADAFPVKSIKKINLGGSGLFGSGPWKAKFITVNGTALSLDDIEHEIVRALFKDEMSHYGLNCASYSCPNLAARTYTGANVDALLRENAVAYVNHPRGVAVENDRITASKIYSWYAGDFGGKGKLKPHWQSLANAQKAAEIQAASISGYDYDWSINSQ